MLPGGLFLTPRLAAECARGRSGDAGTVGGVPEPEPLLALWLGTVGGRVECASLGEEATGELAMTRQDKTRRDEARRGETEERRGKGERGDKGEKRGQRGKGEKQYYCISIRPPFRKAKGVSWATQEPSRGYG